MYHKQVYSFLSAKSNFSQRKRLAFEFCQGWQINRCLWFRQRVYFPRQQYNLCCVNVVLILLSLVLPKTSFLGGKQIFCDSICYDTIKENRVLNALKEKFSRHYEVSFYTCEGRFSPLPISSPLCPWKNIVGPWSHSL